MILAYVAYAACLLIVAVTSCLGATYISTLVDPYWWRVGYLFYACSGYISIYYLIVLWKRRKFITASAQTLSLLIMTGVMLTDYMSETHILLAILILTLQISVFTLDRPADRHRLEAHPVYGYWHDLDPADAYDILWAVVIALFLGFGMSLASAAKPAVQKLYSCALMTAAIWRIRRNLSSATP